MYVCMYVCMYVMYVCRARSTTRFYMCFSRLSTYGLVCPEAAGFVGFVPSSYATAAYRILGVTQRIIVGEFITLCFHILATPRQYTIKQKMWQPPSALWYDTLL